MAIDINKLRTACRNFKGRRIYQFFLDETTGEITDITHDDKYVKVTRCEDCIYWDKKDGTFPDIDGNEWHNCKCWQEKTQTRDSCTTPAWHYCGWADENDEDEE